MSKHTEYWKNLSLENIKYINPETEKEEIEEWRDIAGYEGRYQVSNCGRIKSFSLGLNKGRVLKQHKTSRGYLRLELNLHSKSRNWFVHVLVAQSFVPNHFGKPQVNHRSAVKCANVYYNLEWNTDMENKTHAKSNGLYKKLVGELNGHSILKESDVLIIANSDKGNYELSKMFMVSPSAIGLIKSGARWGSITGKKHNRSRLTKDEVLEIYNSPNTGVVLAKKYGVTHYQISRIKTGVKWSSVTGHKKNRV